VASPSPSYVAPLHMSASLADLLARIFVRDPEQRITLAGILAHDWMQPQLADVRQVVGLSVLLF
jgi:serine/threonine protein kinase